MVAPLGHVLVELLLVADSGLSTVSHDHGLGLAVEQVHDVLAEVLDDDGNLLPNRGRVQRDVLEDLGARLARLHLDVFAGLLQLEGQVIGDVALQHVQDEAFFDGLAHGIHMERHRQTIGALATKQLQRLGLRGGGEGVVRDVGRTLTRGNDLGDHLLAPHFDLIGLFSAGFWDLFGFVFQPLRGQGLAQLHGTLA